MPISKLLKNKLNSLPKWEQNQVKETALLEGISLTESIKYTLRRKEEQHLQKVNDDFFIRNLV